MGRFVTKKLRRRCVPGPDSSAWRRRLARNYAYFVFEYNLLSLQRRQPGNARLFVPGRSFLVVFALLSLLHPPPPPLNAFISSFESDAAIHGPLRPPRCRAYRSVPATDARDNQSTQRVCRADHATLT